MNVSKLFVIVLGLVACRLTRSSIGFVFTMLPMAFGLAAIQGGKDMGELLRPKVALKSISVAVGTALVVGGLVFRIIGLAAAGVAAGVTVFLLSGMIGLIMFGARRSSSEI